MTPRKPCPTVPGPLKEYAQCFDDMFRQLAQRRSVWEYLLGLLFPCDRNKTLTALVGTEPVVDAPAPLANNATITEISLVDLPRILASLSRGRVKFQDETLRDKMSAETA
jgi:hypothetical protein